MSDVWFTINFPDGGSFSFTRRIVLGILFLGAAAFFRLRAVDNKKKWDSMFKIFPPTLEYRVSIFTSASRGISNGVAYLFLTILWITSGAIGFDLIMFEGRILWENSNEIMSFLASVPARLQR